jgi:hypothetical protein
VPLHGRVRGIDRDLIRGGHYGQRSYEPHTKAEHMAAPTKAAPLQKSPCQRGAVHTWHLSSYHQWKVSDHTFHRCPVRHVLSI